jgi:hypothetical protein
VRSGRDLARAGRQSLPETLPTALRPLDDLLAGGLLRGRLVELVGRRSCGRFSTLLATLAAVTTAGEVAALVDLGDGFDPRSAALAEVELERLLWLRPRHLKQALHSAELLLISGFPLVVLDLGSPPVAGGRGVESSWLRLARCARDHGSALLVSSPYRVSGSAATAVLEACRARPAWKGRGLAPRLLAGLQGSLTLAKARGRSPGPGAPLPFQVPELPPVPQACPAPQVPAAAASRPRVSSTPLPVVRSAAG